MSRHAGAHPRHGATDVVPFVPVTGVTMADCVALARGVGERIGAELGIPVYLYEEAARRPERRNLAHCRQGEYEALPQKLGRPEWTPDHGPDAWSPAVARSGATNVGARQFLVAYNVNLNTRAKRIASDIALDVREQGRARRDAEGKIVKGPDGQNEMIPGALKAVQGGRLDDPRVRPRADQHQPRQHLRSPSPTRRSTRSAARPSAAACA